MNLTRRQDILLEIAASKRQQDIPADAFNPKYIKQFTNVLKTKLVDRTSSFGKQYLKVLINEIRMQEKEATISGSYDAMANAIIETKKMGTELTVPTFTSIWLTKSDDTGNWIISVQVK